MRCAFSSHCICSRTLFMVYLREESHVILLRDFALLQLQSGDVAVIDIDDAEAVSRYEWRLTEKAKLLNTYAVRTGRGGGLIFLHRFLKGIPPRDKRVVDHIDGDGLNNRRSNLRFATNAENSRNQRIRSNNTSGFKGVRMKDGKFLAQITVAGKYKNLGRFATAEAAHAAYLDAAKKGFGEFARER